MNYTLQLGSESFPVEDVRLPIRFTLKQAPEGRPVAFVSPHRLPAGKQGILAGEIGEYQVIVHGCFAFHYNPRFFVTGRIVARQED